MIEILFKGVAIGLLTSAPMGPINMLCVQRTLNRGRWHGFVTGLGALFSDLIYGFVTLWGMSFAADFLTKNEITLQFIGSVVLVLFGLSVFKTNPLKGWTPTLVADDTRYVRYFFSSFLLTFTNVAILFVFATLFARFSFNPIVDGQSFLAAGILGIGLGALSWWFFLSSFVSRIRKHFNRDGLKLLNRIVGIILMLIGVGGILMSAFNISL